ncbi:MAG: competence protein ComEC [Nocardioides sp.]|nr:competence protein ComEC [Nocardioides sp.]
MPAVAGTAWLAGVGALVLPIATVVGVLITCAAGLLFTTRRVDRVRRRAAVATVLAALVVASGVAASAVLRQSAVDHGPLADLAAERAAVRVEAVTGGDPRRFTGTFGTVQVFVRVQVRVVEGRGLRHDLRRPVLVLGGEEWAAVPLGAPVSTVGRLAPTDDRETAALLDAGPPRVDGRPDVWWRGAAAVRAGVREAVSGRPDDQRALVPALVDGDDTDLDPALADDFRTTGLTHLTAVSGTNLTLLVAFLGQVGAWCGVRGRARHVLTALGVVGFVLLARTEPSVLRAAAMGTVGLLALGSGGRGRALRGLGVAVVVLLLVQPALAITAGFALSVLATAGIVLLAPGWRDAMTRWVPRWLAEAIAVPAAAQLACTPVVAALSSQVSLVAVAANLLVGPVVGPATVLGLAGGLVALVHAPTSHLLGTPAGLCVGWIVTVARRGADVPGAAVDWPSNAPGLVVLTALCLVLVPAVPLVRRLRARRGGAGEGSTARRLLLLALTTLLVVAALRTAPAGGLALPGLPDLRLPPGSGAGEAWDVALCDVGQGDALVLRTGPASGVVVDTGPEPGPVDDCLDRLGVDRVPLLVLTHFHADHVGGVTGVLDGREVDEVWTSPLRDPPDTVAAVAAELAEMGPALGAVPDGATTYGAVTLTPLWPLDRTPRDGPGDGSTANDASLVLLAEVGGLRVLLTGDVEPPAQAGLARALPGLRVDVLKVPHHGSAHQDTGWLCSLGAAVALVPVGVDNDYGHPAASTLDALEACGARVRRTDLDGTVLLRGG